MSGCLYIAWFGGGEGAPMWGCLARSKGFEADGYGSCGRVTLLGMRCINPDGKRLQNASRECYVI